MKKINLFTVVLFLTLALCACGSDNEPKRIDKSGDTQVSSQAGDNGSAGTSAQSLSNAGYVFEAEASGKKVAVSVDSPMSGILKDLGDPVKYFEAKSCAFDGIDKTYTYSHFIITTYPSSDGDMISAIDLIDDLVSTKEGLSIGSSKSEMEKLYGTDYRANGSECIYTKGNMTLRILFTDDKVSYITYASSALTSAGGN